MIHYMVVILLIKRDPRPIVVVATVRIVGKVAVANVALAASFDDSATFAWDKYSETMCRQ